MSSTNLFVHAESVLHAVDDTTAALLVVLLAAGGVSDLLAGRLLAVWDSITGRDVSCRVVSFGLVRMLTGQPCRLRW